MCEKCSSFSERLRFDEREYIGLLEQLKRLVQKKTFDEVADDLPLEYASDRKNWPVEGLIHHVFVCNTCRGRFELRFDTHRFTGSWQSAPGD
jgi:predicted metal-binding protein